MRDIASPLDGFASPFGPGRRTLTNLLFGQNEPGFTFEPWDMTTLYQDRAGTTPVTAAGQSVGLRLSKDQGLRVGPERISTGTIGLTGSATAATYDVLTGSGTVSRVDASNQSWIRFSGLNNASYYKVTLTNSSLITLAVKSGSENGTSVIVVVAGQTQTGYVQPSGGVITIAAAGGGTSLALTISSFRELAGNHEVAVSDAKRGLYGWMPKTGKRNLLNATDTLSTQSVTVTAVAHTLAFTGTGTVTLSGVSTAGPLIGTGASNRVTLTFTPTAGSLTLTVSGSVTLAQLQLGSADTAYQRVVSQYDITEAGVPTCYYVQADGVDDAYVTPTITPGTDKVQVFAGVRKLSDSPPGHILGGNGNNSGQFETLSGGWMTPANRYGAGFFTDAVLQIDSPASFTPPRSDVLSWRFDTAGATGADKVKLNVSGISQTLSISGVPAQGNFGAFAHYIYSRAGTLLPFNGLDFGHAVRFGPNLDAATIARVESLIARNTPEVTL